ncbi:outer membrane beta-barrel domain-containing protein [Arsukibacterium indicum]|uniref:Outer membrane beta-barrel domain-containing protein n=1 Tax=Arsukibacterium indicum TaxID=2848612 RepID=A0ABS6MHN6_9GAMM|nr:outer membrane beta-barrel domain-containing protein [Arsukibacterium indicum]MBV2128322.1 outer membrane beta-barrel domain-containing protein [Arsukibacterium indicum]
MVNWIAPGVLASVLLVISSTAVARQNSDSNSRIEPDITQSEVIPARLDTENFAVGLRGGALAIEDFGTSGLAALQLSYHINEDFYISAEYAMAKAGLTSYERLSGAAPLLTDDERQWHYYGAELGYVLLPGQVYLGRDYAINTGWSVFGGAGNVDFAGDTVFAFKFGSQFRLYLTDWAALDLVVTDYVFETTILAENKTTHNLSMALGLAVYF